MFVLGEIALVPSVEIHAGNCFRLVHWMGVYMSNFGAQASRFRTALARDKDVLIQLTRARLVAAVLYGVNGVCVCVRHVFGA